MVVSFYNNGGKKEKRAEVATSVQTLMHFWLNKVTEGSLTCCLWTNSDAECESFLSEQKM